MERCPACERELTSREQSRGVCPQCGAKLPATSRPAQAGWGDFPGASLEFDASALQELADEFEIGDDAAPEAEAETPAAPEDDLTDKTVADGLFAVREDAVDASATVILDSSDLPDSLPAESRPDPPPRPAGDAAPKTQPLDRGRPRAGEIDMRMFASLEIDSDLLSDASTAADEPSFEPPDDADRTFSESAAADDDHGAPPDSSGPPRQAEVEQTLPDAGVVKPPSEVKATTLMSEPVVDRSAADSSTATPTPEELRTLNREWGDASGRPEMTIKSLADEFGSLRDSANISDTVELLPHRRLRSVGDETMEHPEYELVRVLGEGGMGIVWDARQISVDRSVAVKMIKGPYARAPKQRKKFLAEAVVTGDLDHPNIVPVYDVGRDVHGSLFYAMKHVQGTPWEQVLKQTSLHENLGILLRVADAVAFAHSRGIIHRDLKPENVMLGEFGETLVMDWGLALPTEEYRKSNWLEFSKGMGGTPAYMAPEMARGPIDRITKASDVYLLGAILYEIVTGRPPHTGKTVKACLVAAMRNQVPESSQQGELLSVALRAMATDPADRYATVQDFQAAVRQYLSHAESLSLTVRAHVDLNSAAETDDYRDYARAVFAFEEAFDLWDGNKEAEAGITQAKLAYAGSAHRKGDYDLGLSLLDSSQPGQRGLHRQLTEAQQERQARQQRLRVAKRVMATMAGVMFLVVTVALLAVSKSRDRQEALRIQADADRLQAELDRDAKQTALGLLAEEVAAKETARAEAVEAQETALGLQAQAEQLKDDALDARDEAEYKAYVAGIGAAGAKIDEGAFDVARDILTQLPARHRNWEWGRLWRLCELYSKRFGDSGPVDAIAVSPDGTRFVVGSRDRTARVRDIETGAVLAELPHDGMYVHGVAWSPQGHIVTGGSDPNGRYLRLWDARPDAGGQRPTALTTFGASHSAPVVSVRCSPDGRWLLSCSYDETARLWDLSDVRNPREAFVFAEHDWWVWDAAFAPGFSPGDPAADNRVVTVGQDGKAIVWVQVESETPGAEGSALTFRQDRVFEGHSGPVYSVDFAIISDEGTEAPTVVTGGYDNRVLLWRPEDIQPYGLDSVFGSQAEERIVTIGRDGRATLWRTEELEPPGPRLPAGPERELETIGAGDTRITWRPEDVQPFGLESIVEVSGTPWIYREFRGHVNSVQSVAFSRDGAYVVSAGRDNTVWVWNTNDDTSIRLRGHFNEVRDATFTADGNHVISGGLDEQVLVWSTGTDEEFRVLQGRALTGHDDAVLSASYSRDGSQIVTASRDRTARIWDADDTAQPPVELSEGHEFLVSSAVLFSCPAILPDEAGDSLLLTAAADDTARLWDAVRGTELLQLRGTGRNGFAALSPDQRWIVTGADGNFAQLWDLVALWNDPDGYHPLALHGRFEHHAPVTTAAWSPSPGLLATGDDNGRVILWDIGDGAPQQRWSERRQEQRISAIAFVPDGSQVLTASSDGTVAVLAAIDGAQIGRLLVRNPVTALAVCETDGVVRLVTASDASADNRTNSNDVDAVRERTSAVQVWDLGRSEVVSRFDALPWAVLSVSAPSGGDSALIACSDNEIRRLPLTGTAGRLEAISLELPQPALAGAVASSDGASLVTLSGSDAMLFDAGTGRLIMTYRPHGAVAGAQFSPEGTRIVTGSWDRSIKIWDPATRQAVERFDQVHQGFINSVAFAPVWDGAPEGGRILTASDDACARIRDANSGELLVQFSGHTGPVRCAVFSPDGRRVLTASDDRTVRLWDADPASPTLGQQIGDPFDGHEWPVLCVAFSPNGGSFLSGSEDNEARIWSIAEHRTVARLTGHTAPVTSVAFSIDGLRAFTASRDTTAKVWDVSPEGLSMSEEGTAYNLLTLTGHRRELTSIAVSPNGGHDLLTASRDGSAIIWNAAPWNEAGLPPMTASAPLPAAAD